MSYRSIKPVVETKWPDLEEAPPARVTPSQGRGAKRARDGTSVVMRHFRNGKYTELSCYCPRDTCIDHHQSRNCTKHNCRCDYMDSPAANEERPKSPRDPDLLVTPEIQQELDAWHSSGIPTFPELQMTSPGYWQNFKLRDLRLVHHIAGLSIEMHRQGYSGCAVWAQKMPMCVNSTNPV